MANAPTVVTPAAKRGRKAAAPRATEAVGGGPEPVARRVKPRRPVGRLAAAHGVQELRTVVNEAIEQFSVRINAQLADILRIIEGETLKGEAYVRPSPKVSAAIVEEIQSTKLKPHKGRVKDLLRAHDLVEELLDLLQVSS